MGGTAHGAMVGANIGSTEGNVTTGNTDVAGATKDISHSMYQGEMLKHMNTQKDTQQSKEPKFTYEQERKRKIEADEHAKKVEQAHQDSYEIMEEYGLNENQKKHFMLEKIGRAHV